MEITLKSKINYTFGELQNGEIFKSGFGVYYMKVDGKTLNAVNLDNGHIIFFCDNTIIDKIPQYRLQLVIEDQIYERRKN